jgi:glyoxylate utilization-related uncharacterized protein
MTPSAPNPSFAFAHHAWNAVRAQTLGERITLRRLCGGASESWWLELQPSSGFQCSGIPAEAILTVLEGRLSCQVFGNQIELPRGHYAVVPPNITFAVRVGGRSPATALLSAGTLLAEPLPLEAT